MIARTGTRIGALACRYLALAEYPDQFVNHFRSFRRFETRYESGAVQIRSARNSNRVFQLRQL